MRCLIPLLFLAAAPVHAKSLNWGNYQLSADVGIGAERGPAYLGADESENSLWLILRNGSLSRRDAAGGETTDGFSIVPSFGYVGKREASDHDALAGMNDVDAAGEVGAKLNYDQGPTRGYVAVRKGFGGHDGLVGEFGAQYRFSPADRLSLTAGAEARFSDGSFSETYFGVTPDESLASGMAAYEPGGGFYAAAINLEARYSLTENMAILGEIEYSRLLGDAADSPLVQSKSEPTVRLGIVRRIDFKF